jgi:hypothetical protein
MTICPLQAQDSPNGAALRCAHATDMTSLRRMDCLNDISPSPRTSSVSSTGEGGAYQSAKCRRFNTILMLNTLVTKSLQLTCEVAKRSPLRKNCYEGTASSWFMISSGREISLSCASHSAAWCTFTKFPWGRGLINFEPQEEALALETYGHGHVF